MAMATATATATASEPESQAQTQTKAHAISFMSKPEFMNFMNNRFAKTRVRLRQEFIEDLWTKMVNDPEIPRTFMEKGGDRTVMIGLHVHTATQEIQGNQTLE